MSDLAENIIDFQNFKQNKSTSRETSAYPFPPFRMKAPVAAWYCGMSISQFYLSVKEGELPEGRKRRGGTYWLRIELDDAMLERGDVIEHDFARAI